MVRLGGDEFAVVRTVARGRDESGALAERLIAVLAEPFDIEGHHISIGASIGIAETATGGESSDDLLKNADLALYTAKGSGRGTYRFFEPEMDDRIHAKRQLELDLRTAIADRNFELFYQPLLSTQSGRVAVFEALLRWHHPQRGMVSPAEFIPLAEETGLITELGLWVLDRACHDAASWPSDVKVAINLSPLQFRSPDLRRGRRGGTGPLRAGAEPPRDRDHRVHHASGHGGHAADPPRPARTRDLHLDGRLRGPAIHR